MFRSTGARYLIVGLLALLMFIPMILVGSVVDDRANYSRQTARSIGQEWGGAQTLNGPFLEVPVSEEVEVTEVVEIIDPDTGKKTFEKVKHMETQQRAPLFILPRKLDVDLATQTQMRSRGIFNVPVYTAKANFAFDFDLAPVEDHVRAQEDIHWDDAKLILGISSNKALRGAAVLSGGGQDYALEPRTGDGGLYSQVGDIREVKEFTLDLTFNGADKVFVTPLGRNTNVTMTSDWPHPSFAGEFLPEEREISDTGFDAQWSIPHFARSLPQVGRVDLEKLGYSASFGVRFFEPNDFYQRAYRAARYGILFIALTFLTILLLENKEKRAHPVQYLLMGLAQSVFVLLMVAYAEQIGFTAAYLLASGATIALLVMFAATGLKLGKKTYVVGAVLVVVYAVLYLILRSADYALLAGSTIAFAAVGATMFFTRNEDWEARSAKLAVKRPEAEKDAAKEDAAPEAPKPE